MSARNIRYINAEHTAIDLDFDHPTHGWIPMTINEEEYPELWGEVVAANPTPYVGPTPEELREAEARLQRSIRDSYLREVDLVATNPLRWMDLTTTQQSQLAVYRRALLDVPAQPGFPFNIAWPDRPEGIF